MENQLLERSNKITDTDVICQMVNDTMWLLDQAEGSVTWKNEESKRNLIELSHIVFLTSALRENDGRIMTLKHLIEKMFRILHIPIPHNPRSYINGVQLQMLRHQTARIGIMEQYRIMMSNSKIRPIENLLVVSSGTVSKSSVMTRTYINGAAF